MTIERTFQGAYRITEIRKDIYFSEQYFEYTRKEAIVLFRQKIKDFFTKQIFEKR